MSQLIIYTTQWCGDCRRVKRFLNEQNISFTEIDIDQTEGAAEQVIEWSGGRRVIPTVLIDGEILHNPTIYTLKELLSRHYEIN